jgi:hypothetical protein
MSKLLKLSNCDKYTIVDEEDYKELSKNKWRLGKNGYVSTGHQNQKGFFYIHRWLLNIVDRKIQVDHINYDTLDNRRNNLIICTNQQNTFHTRKRKNCSSKYKGVYYDKERNKWGVQIRFNNKVFCIGRFIDEKEAAGEYNKKAIELFGEFAYLNVI